MRKLASVQRIWNIEPIEGADRIELAHVLGWQCVVNNDIVGTDSSMTGKQTASTLRISYLLLFRKRVGHSRLMPGSIRQEKWRMCSWPPVVPEAADYRN